MPKFNRAGLIVKLLEKKQSLIDSAALRTEAERLKFDEWKSKRIESSRKEVDRAGDSLALALAETFEVLSIHTYGRPTPVIAHTDAIDSALRELDLMVDDIISLQSAAYLKLI